MGRQARRPLRRSLIPRVSFILPVHNVENTLAETLDSLVSQTFRDFDVLFYDDGSTDRTAEIVARYIDRDRRFRLVGTERVGLVGALCGALRASDAEFVARIDGDDVCRADRLEKQIALLDSDAEIAAAGSRIRSFSAEGPPGAGMARYTEWLNRQITADEIARAMFVESPLCHPSITFRRAAYDRSCGYLDDEHPEDYRLWLDFYALGMKMCKVPETLLDWRDLPHRLTRTDPRYGPERFMDLKLIYLLRTHLATRPTVTLWGAGKFGRRWRRRLSDAGIDVVQFIDVDPRKIGRDLHGCTVSPVPETPGDISGERLLLAVGSPQARERIETHLQSIDFPPSRTIAVA